MVTENIGDTRYHARYYPRLMAEVLQDAITSVTKVSPKYANITVRRQHGEDGFL